MKKTIAFITAAALSVSMSVSAFASGIAQSVNTVAAKHDAINIIYNGQLLTYTDAVPENINDRIMLPFRAVLEGMGAKVDYDDALRLVTASRGGITIRFTLLDDTIYIDSNGVQSQLKLDVPMIIKNDRTLVPIRFISNALGMQVGWEGDYQTVLIVDADAYAEDLAVNSPNIAALGNDSGRKYNTSAVDLSLKINNDSISAKFDGVFNSGKASAKGKISANVSNLGINAENATVEALAENGKIYVKTDALSGLGISGDTWYYADVNALVEKALGDRTPSGAKEIYKKFLSGDFSSLKNTSIQNMIAQSGVTKGDATLSSAMEADMTADICKALDKHIKITDNKTEFNITTADFIKILSDVLHINTSEFENKITFDVSSVSEYGETEANMKTNLSAGANDFTVALNMTETAKTDDGAEVAAAPADAVDMMPIIEQLIK